ncbi:ferredoxin--NADP+ reductase [Rhodococcus sp. 27YEA15]|uniref:FAD-dependent oxidoreductase n=1 Tax=Rhodococcus sp. 27YEA15 TaxID=3156259 RepID=UPI003C7B4BA1
MAYVITQACCNDASCVAVCPVDCIHPRPDEPEFTTAEMLYIDPNTCIDCGACFDECPVDAITEEHALRDEHRQYRAINADYYTRHPITDNPPEPAHKHTLDPNLGTLHVAIVGTGPAACYAAIELTTHPRVEITMFERLPTPYGLIRAGVAPDHPGTKAVTDIFRLTMGKRSVHCHFNIDVGHHITHTELLEHHHAVLYAVGAPDSRHLDIPGEHLPGSHPATDFVAWYNGHPDHTHHTFDLTGERAVIIGNGNVALDIARILLTDPDTLATTDIADHALHALRAGNTREVVVIGRRGPAHAAYTNPELIALGQLPDIDIIVDPTDALLDPASRTWIDGPHSEPSEKLKVHQIEQFAAKGNNNSTGTGSSSSGGGRKRIVLRYLTAPEEILGEHHVEAIRLVHNELLPDPDHPHSPDTAPTLTTHATEHTHTLPTNLVLRSIGYKSRPIPDLPFDEHHAIVPNDHGRVLDPDTGTPIPGVYVAGWIKRGPTGVIGTNKHCSSDTIDKLLTDFTHGHLTPPLHNHTHLHTLLTERQPDLLDFPAWQRIDTHERTHGKQTGRPRTKITDTTTMLDIAHGPTH